MGATTTAGASCSVLIVEDDHDDVFLLARALRAASTALDMSVEVTYSDNGFDALGSVARGDLTDSLPDVVVVDLNMPVMGGELFLRRLRGELELVKVPTVVLTTSNDWMVHTAALSSGANYVFVKPNNFSDLVIIASKVLEVATEGARATE